MRRFVIGHLAFVICLAVLAVFLTSCRNNIVYSHFCSIPSENWHMDSVAQFDYNIEDAGIDYQMLLYVRHTERYPYQNMWLFVDNGIYQDTIEFYLADDRGQWLGDKKHGLMEMPVLLEEQIHYPDTGMYRLTVQHGMRDSLLRGVADVGLEIVKSK
ncbi:MAG: gliding motility lipoprotein GldH [Paludibacteraceae bacterium]|nr:gliding motility lipoprotein GldH [Paludibacteraceae bacterium]